MLQSHSGGFCVWSAVFCCDSSGTWNERRRRRRRDRVNIELSVHMEIIQIIMILDIYFHICLHRHRETKCGNHSTSTLSCPIVVMGFFNAKDSLFSRLLSLSPPSQWTQCYLLIHRSCWCLARRRTNLRVFFFSAHYGEYGWDWTQATSIIFWHVSCVSDICFTTAH